ncbi:hypothetical protein M4578_25355 [Salipiger sp. P9]|uniref:hypothetical protein n=1 Tax=Salipiger pentaromativorans TaxID=2943193 RepID=UPI00215849E5|nr:hypothetical protein [Salipiger pentaromativorans]MCR8551157.1 hypothetical protein [Salipiger pentaromativorans]
MIIPAYLTAISIVRTKGSMYSKEYLSLRTSLVVGHRKGLQRIVCVCCGQIVADAKVAARSFGKPMTCCSWNLDLFMLSLLGGLISSDGALKPRPSDLDPAWCHILNSNSKVIFLDEDLPLVAGLGGICEEEDE